MANGPSPRPSVRSGAAVAGFFLLLAWAACRLLAAPPAPLGADAPATEFSAARARAVLERLLGDETPRPVGSAANHAVRERLIAELEALGLEPQVQRVLQRGANGWIADVRNVVARVPGKRAGPMLALVAHYDSVAAGPGAADDGAGVAAIVECVRALQAGGGLEHPLLVLITDAEEAGLIGATAFVAHHPWAKEVRAAVNLEARGTTGLAYLFQTGADAGPALARFGALAPRPSATSIAALIYDRMPNDTDFTVLRAGGWSGFNFAFIGGVARYHTPLDDLAHLDPRSLQHLGDGALAGIRALDAAGVEPGAGDAVYHDVLGRWLLRWPAAGTAPLAALAFAALVVAAWRRRVGARDLVGPALAGLAGIALAGLLCAAATRALVAIHGVPDPWTAHPRLWDALALAWAVLGFALAASTRLGRARDALCAFLGSWLPIIGTGLILGLLAPAVAPLFLIPGAVAALAAWAWPTDRPGARGTWIALVPCTAAAVLWFPLIHGIEDAVGFHVGAVPSALFAIVAASTLPALGAGARPLAAAAGLACAGLGLAAALVPAYTAEDPGTCNLVHVQAADRAQWCVQTGEDSVAFRSTHTWSERRWPLVWAPVPRAGFLTDAARHDEPPPVLEVLEVHRTDDLRTVRARLRSLRAATTLAVRRDAERIASTAVRLPGEASFQTIEGKRSLRLTGIGPEGIELQLEIRGVEPCTLEFLDARSGLPAGVEDLPALRPADRSPRSTGDGSVVVTSADL